MIRASFLLLATAAACAPASIRPIDRISTEGIQADLAFVACDEMGGRDTPSLGQRLTARFIRNRLERLGWQPGGRDGWFHVFELVNRTLDEAGCSASARCGDLELHFAFASDYSFAPQQVMDLDLTADIVHLGSVPAESKEIEAAAVRGKWAFFSQPGGDLQAADGALMAAGAVGVLAPVHVISNLGGDPEGGVVFKLFSDLMRKGRISWPEKKVLPRVYLKRKTVDALFDLGRQERSRTGPMAIRFTDRRRVKLDEKVACENVTAFRAGRSLDTVIVSAHYDHVGIDRRGQVLNGADDNASGACALLALAEALGAQADSRASTLLIWTSAEELGLWGSRAFVENPWLPEGARPVANINLDMIGRNSPSEILITPFDSSHARFNPWAGRAKAIAIQEGFAAPASGDGYFERSDQAMFAKLNIPVVFLTDGMHADYHQPGDDPEKIDADKVRRVARIVFRLLTE